MEWNVIIKYAFRSKFQKHKYYRYKFLTSFALVVLSCKLVSSDVTSRSESSGMCSFRITRTPNARAVHQIQNRHCWVPSRQNADKVIAACQANVKCLSSSVWTLSWIDLVNGSLRTAGVEELRRPKALENRTGEGDADSVCKEVWGFQHLHGLEYEVTPMPYVKKPDGLAYYDFWEYESRVMQTLP